MNDKFQARVVASASNQPVTWDHVEIDAGICKGSDSPSEIGRTLYMVGLVDREGCSLADYVGTDRDAADRAAVGLARDFGIRIEDKTGGEA